MKLLKIPLVFLLMMWCFTAAYGQTFYMDSLVKKCKQINQRVETNMKKKFSQAACYSPAFEVIPVFHFSCTDKVTLAGLNDNSWIKKLKPSIFKNNNLLAKKSNKWIAEAVYMFVEKATYKLQAMGYHQYPEFDQKLLCNNGGNLFGEDQSFAYMIRDKQMDVIILLSNFPNMYVCFKGDQAFYPKYDRLSGTYELIPLKDYVRAERELFSYFLTKE